MIRRDGAGSNDSKGGSGLAPSTMVRTCELGLIVRRSSECWPALHDVLAESQIAALLGAANATIPEEPDSDDASEDDSAGVRELLLSGGASGVPWCQVVRRFRQPTIDDCPECAAPIHLPAVQPGKPTETWRCLDCGAVWLTGPTVGPSPASRRAEKRTSEDPRFPISAMPVSVPATRRRLLQDLTRADYIGPEHRKYPRTTVSLPTIATPMARDGSIIGTPFRATTREISMIGIGLFCEEPVTSPCLLVDFTPSALDGWQVVLRIVRRHTAGFLNEVGGELLVAPPVA